MQVYQRLQKLHVCMSHTGTIRLMDKVGEGFDRKVYAWKKEVEDTNLSMKVCVTKVIYRASDNYYCR